MQYFINIVIFIFISFTHNIQADSILDSYSHIDGEELLLSVSSLNSIKTQIPFEYYYLNVCPPEDPIEVKDNIGEMISGQKSYFTNYKIKINKNEYCILFCEKKMSKKSYNQFKWLISKDYTINWYLDLLPAGYGKSQNLNTSQPSLEVQYNGGIPVGYIKKFKKDKEEISNYYIYNHYRLYVHLHKVNNKSQIVGFEIEPFSIKQNSKDSLLCSNNIDKNGLSVLDLLSKEPQIITDNEEIMFTYDVVYKESDIVFASRFDHYSHINSDIHWIGIINSTILILILTLLTIIVLTRSIKQDIEVYNTKISGDEIIDEYGWKTVANEVFRKPPYYEFFCSLLGSGVQLFIMIIYTLLFASFNFLKPDVRGSVLTLMITVFIFLGLVAGYVSARAYKMFYGRHWFRLSLTTAFFFPEGSNAGMDFKEIYSMTILWMGCSTPLIIFGTFVGIKQRTLELPGRINAVPADIPSKPWYFHLKYSIFVAGLIPFAAIFTELIYIMSSIWRHEIYFLAMFVMIAILIFVIITSEIGFLYTYINLCKQDYKWWWKCFIISASPIIYIFIYSFYYFFELKMSRLSTIIIYFGLMGLIILFTALICGSLGVITTFIFLVKMYSMIRID